MRRIIPYGATLLAFLALDSIWLSLTSAPIYRKDLADILLPGFRALPAVLFYLGQVLAIQIFVLPRAQRLRGALGFGAAFGLFTYATYDLTNWATLKIWPASLAIIDMGWGTVITALGSAAGYGALRWYSRALPSK